MPSRSDDNAFAKLMQENCIDEVKISGSALDTAIEFIGDNLNPDDVFPQNVLEDWAERNGYKKDE